MSAPIRVRLSPAFQTTLAPLSGNTSATVRALMLVGLHAAGIGLKPSLQRESTLLALSDDLAAPLRSALARLSELSYECPTDVGHLSYTPPAAEGAARETAAADPFAAIGIDV